jgi:hypothetical protein
VWKEKEKKEIEEEGSKDCLKEKAELGEKWTGLEKKGWKSSRVNVLAAKSGS